MKLFKNNPIKPSLRTEIVPVLSMIVIAISSGYFYSKFPESVPTHWDFKGNPNDWSSRFVAAFILPLAAVFIYLGFLAFPFFDPKNREYHKFAKTYHIFKASIILFMAAIYFVASLNVIGYNIRIEMFTPVLVGLIFVIIGNYMGKIKNNWFMGIRTPWTLSSEENWNKTHRLGGKIYVIGGIIIMTINLFPDSIRSIVFITDIIFISLLPVVYSLVLFIKAKK